METAVEIIRRITGEKTIDSFVAEVTEVRGRVCDVLPLDGAELKNVRLNTELSKDVGLLVSPVKGSKVLITKLSEIDCFVSLFSEIEKVEIVIGNTSMLIKDGAASIVCGQAAAKIASGKFSLSNQAYTLKQSFNELIAELKAAIITTPTGPGSFSPSTVAKLTIINNKVNQLLS